jgi:hypothetical protein
MKILIADPHFIVRGTAFERGVAPGAVISRHGSVLPALGGRRCFRRTAPDQGHGSSGHRLRLIHDAAAGFDGTLVEGLPRGLCANTFHHEGSVANTGPQSSLRSGAPHRSRTLSLRQDNWRSSVCCRRLR